MQRLRTNLRPNWTTLVESQGLSFHTTPAGPYWDESAYYQFTRPQVDRLERATYALNDLCLKAVEHLLTDGRQLLASRFLLPEPFVEFCARSWERDEISIYGRFDLAFDGHSAPKMLEYNADTPTALLEAAAVQWFWMKDVFAGSIGMPGGVDQFNSIHEKLIEAWTRWRTENPAGTDVVTFLGLSDSDEDTTTVEYLRDTAIQAGLRTLQMDVRRLGWNAPRRVWVDEMERPIRACFKLYPWEWMLREPFAAHLPGSFDAVRWLEPPWKMILSNKAILPVLWQMFPGHENLLPAAFERLPGRDCVRKPVFGREGQGVTILPGGSTEPPYVPPTEMAGPPVYQAHYRLPAFDGNHPVIGSWMVNGHACGIGIREDRTTVTGNTSRFVPHVFR